MNKKDLFIAAMKAGCYKKISWLISAFCITRESEDKWKSDFYPYRLVPTATGYFYCSPDKIGELVKVEGSINQEALYNVKETLEITPSDIPNLKENAVVSYGSLIVNWITLVYPFGDKIDYQFGEIRISNIEKLILAKLKDNPPEGISKDDNAIYVNDYVKFADSMFYLSGLTQICVWAATEKTILPPPGIKEFKEKLLEENKSRLNEAAVIAKIDAQLVEYDFAWLKGDPAENFLISNKSRNTVRRKLFLMQGAEIGLDDNSTEVKLIKNSLNEGWEVESLPESINSLRAGSFNRGAETELGGVSVKWLLRASSNINVTVEDCKSDLGIVTIINEASKEKLIGFSLVTKEGSKKLLSPEDVSSYLGKKVMVRSPMYCKLSSTDYCKICVGDKLAANPDGLSIAIAGYGSSLVSIFLKSAHAKSLQLAKMDFNVALT